MKPLVLTGFGQKSAQDRAARISRFGAGRLRGTVGLWHSSLPANSRFTRYPSPFHWSGPFGVGSAFVAVAARQGFACDGMSRGIYFPDGAVRAEIDHSLTQSKGRAACVTSNLPPFRPLCSSSRAVLTTMPNARLQAQRPVRLLRTPRAATSWPVRPSVRLAAPCATTQTSVTKFLAAGRIAPARNEKRKAIGAPRTGGLFCVLAKADAPSPNAGRDWECSKRS